MRRTLQTRLADFDESEKSEVSQPEPLVVVKRERPKGQLWQKTTQEGEEWGVCNLDDTVFLVRLIDGRLHAHGMEAFCKYCSGILEIREHSKVFCSGQCGRYQGEFSADLNDYLRWEGAKSYTLRLAVAEAEGLQLEERDLEPIEYAPNWSVFEEYDETE